MSRAASCTISTRLGAKMKVPTACAGNCSKKSETPKQSNRNKVFIGVNNSNAFSRVTKSSKGACYAMKCYIPSQSQVLIDCLIGRPLHESHGLLGITHRL